MEPLTVIPTERAYMADLGITIRNGLLGDSDDVALRDFRIFYPQIREWMRDHHVRLCVHSEIKSMYQLCVTARRSAPLNQFIERWGSMLEDSAVLFRNRVRGLPLTLLTSDHWITHRILPKITRLCPYGFELHGDWQSREAVKDQLRAWLAETQPRGPIVVYDRVYFHAEQDLVLARLASVLNR